jgi:HEPN domain-containing protein
MKDSLDPREWIRFAQNDLDMALMGAARFRPPIEGVCYSCHQSAEKILKAYIIANGDTHRKTHTLADLLNNCERYSPDFNALGVACLKLTPFATAARYQTDMDLIDNDMRQALKYAEQILDFTKAKLKELGYEYNPQQAENPTA